LAKEKTQDSDLPYGPSQSAPLCSCLHYRNWL